MRRFFKLFDKRESERKEILKCSLLLFDLVEREREKKKKYIYKMTKITSSKD